MRIEYKEVHEVCAKVLIRVIIIATRDDESLKISRAWQLYIRFGSSTHTGKVPVLP